MRSTLLILAVLTLAVPAQSADPKQAPKVTYDDHVLPLLRDKCIGCHNQDKKSGGLILNNYTKVMEGSSSGPIVKPGNPDGSAIYLAVTHKQEPFMPPKSPPLPKESAELIHKWIAGGALENAGSKAVVAKPKIDVSLTSVVKGKPEGPPPMPPATLALDPVVKTARANAVTALTTSPWAPLLAVAGQKQVLLYHSDTLELLGVLPFPEGVAHVLKFSRNGSLLLAAGGRGGKSGRVVVWGVTSGERIIAVGDETDCVLAADISPDQTQIALGGPSKMIRIYSTRDAKLVSEIKKHTDWVTAMEYSPDGVLLATGDRNGGLFVWEAFTAREYFSLRGHTAGITDVSWRGDGNVCASGSEDGTVRLWEMENGGQVRVWGAHPGVQAVRYGKDGRLVSCGRDRLVKLWDGNGGLQRTFDALPDVALRTTFSHDGARVVGGDWSGQLPVWTTADGKRVGQLLANPPGLTERLDLLQKELAARQQARDQLVAAVAVSKTAAQKAATDLAAAQKAVGDTAAAAKAAQDGVAKAKDAADKAKAALAAAQPEVGAKTVLSQALAGAAAQVKGVADKSPADKSLAAVAARSRDLATQAATELTQAQKAVADLTAAAKTADTALATAQQAATAATATAAAAPKTVETLTAQAKAAAAKAATDETAANAAVAALAATVASVEKVKAALSVVRQPAK